MSISISSIWVNYIFRNIVRICILFIRFLNRHRFPLNNAESLFYFKAVLCNSLFFALCQSIGKFCYYILNTFSSHFLSRNLFNNSLCCFRCFSIRVLWWEQLHRFARIIAEHSLLYSVGAVVASEHCHSRVRCRVFAFAYLYDSTTAVPTVGREIFIPKRIGSRQCGFVQ